MALTRNLTHYHPCLHQRLLFFCSLLYDSLCSKDVRLPVQLQRAMAAEAESARDARAKVRSPRKGDSFVITHRKLKAVVVIAGKVHSPHTGCADKHGDSFLWFLSVSDFIVEPFNFVWREAVSIQVKTRVETRFVCNITSNCERTIARVLGVKNETFAFNVILCFNCGLSFSNYWWFVLCGRKQAIFR